MATKKDMIKYVKACIKDGYSYPTRNTNRSKTTYFLLDEPSDDGLMCTLPNYEYFKVALEVTGNKEFKW